MNRISALLCAIVMITVSVLSGFEMSVKADTTDYTGINLMQYATLSTTSEVASGDVNVLKNGNKTWDKAGSTTAPAAEPGVVVNYDSTSMLAHYQADFDREVPLGRILLFLHVVEVEKRPQDIAVDVKLADGTWKRVAERHSSTSLPIASTTGKYGEQAVCIPMRFESVDCVGFRVTANGQRMADNNDGNPGKFRLVEIEAFNVPGSTATGTTEDTNSAYNIPHIQQDYTGRNLMEYATLSTTSAVSGDVSVLKNGRKAWSAGNGTTVPYRESGVVASYDADMLAHYQADFDRELPLGKLLLFLYVEEVEKRPQDIAVDVKLADGTWKRVAERHDCTSATWVSQGLADSQNAVCFVMNFESVECMGFRVTANGQRIADNDSGTAGAFRLVEIEAFSAMNANATATGINKDSNNAYNIPDIQPDYTGKNLMEYATLSTTSAVNGDVSVLKNGRKAWSAGNGTTVPYRESGVVVSYDADMLAHYQADFDRELPLGKLLLFLYVEEVEKRPQDIAVDVKLADGTWKRVAERHDCTSATWVSQGLADSQNAVCLVMNFESVECMGFRVTANGQRIADNNSGKAGAFRLVEIEAFSAMNANATVTGINKDSNSAYNIPDVEETTPDSGNQGGQDGPDDNEDQDAQIENLMKYATVSSTSVLAGKLSYLTDEIKTWDTAGDASVPNVQTGVAVGYDSVTKLAYYQADFDSAVSLGQVRLYLYVGVGDERPQDIAVDVKLTDGTWKRVAERHDITYGNEAWSIQTISDRGAIAVYLGMNFETEECTAFRVTANGQRTADENKKTGNFRLVEIEAYKEFSSTQTVTGTTEDTEEKYNIPQAVDIEPGTGNEDSSENLMKYATVSSTSILTGKLSHLTDGIKTWDTAGDTTVPNVQTGVAVAYDGIGGLSYYQANFDTEVSLGQVRLYLYVGVGEERPQDIAVDVKLADGTWKRVAERHDITYGNGVWTIQNISDGGAIAVYLGMNFETEKCTAFRVTANGQRTADENKKTGNFRLVEMEAYATYPPTQTATGSDKDINEKYNILYIGRNDKVIVFIDYAAFGLTEKWQTTLLSKKINYDGVVGGSRASSSTPSTGDSVQVLGIVTGIMTSAVILCGYMLLRGKERNNEQY